jgi:hypothetical protein
MNHIIETLKTINEIPHDQKYIYMIKLINPDYCNMLVESLKTTHDNNAKNIIIKLMTEIASFDMGRKELVKSDLCVFICDMLKNELVEEYILDSALLIGYLGLSDSARPRLFNNGISNIIINVLTNLKDIESKVKIMNVIKMLSQTKLETNEFIQLGILNHLLEALPKVDTEKLKGDLTSQIYWISYLSGNKDIINNTDCIDIMYKVSESITNKSLQSQIFVYIHYFIKHKPENKNYSLYSFWKNNFNEYLKL